MVGHVAPRTARLELIQIRWEMILLKFLEVFDDEGLADWVLRGDACSAVGDEDFLLIFIEALEDEILDIVSIEDTCVEFGVVYLAHHVSHSEIEGS